MQNIRESDAAAENVVFATKIEDVIGGITLAAADFVDGSIVPAGTLVYKDVNGLYHALKTAKATATATNVATTYQVAKGHNFKVGEFFAALPGAKSYDITAIDKSNAAYDVITVSTTLGAVISVGQGFFQALAAVASTSAVIATPTAITGHTVEINAGDNNTVDAWLRASVIEANAPVATAALKALVPQILYLP